MLPNTVAESHFELRNGDRKIRRNSTRLGYIRDAVRFGEELLNQTFPHTFDVQDVIIEFIEWNTPFLRIVELDRDPIDFINWIKQYKY